MLPRKNTFLRTIIAVLLCLCLFPYALAGGGDDTVYGGVPEPGDSVPSGGHGLDPRSWGIPRVLLTERDLARIGKTAVVSDLAPVNSVILGSNSFSPSSDAPSVSADTMGTLNTTGIEMSFPKQGKLDDGTNLIILAISEDGRYYLTVDNDGHIKWIPIAAVVVIDPIEAENGSNRTPDTWWYGVTLVIFVNVEGGRSRAIDEVDPDRHVIIKGVEKNAAGFLYLILEIDGSLKYALLPALPRDEDSDESGGPSHPPLMSEHIILAGNNSIPANPFPTTQGAKLVHNAALLQYAENGTLKRVGYVSKKESLIPIDGIAGDYFYTNLDNVEGSVLIRQEDVRLTQTSNYEY